MNTGRYNLKQLLTNTEVDQIIIPEIQRDYVWETTNVEKLLNTIWGNFSKKIQMNISIQDNRVEKEIEETLRAYLAEEYSRLKFNTRVGFIYAYSDSDYAGKFFLIDGQQRITTLYLLLLALYIKAYPVLVDEKNKESDTDDSRGGNEFKSLYFKNNQLKLDYKVREVAHDFMQSFVIYVLSHNGSEGFETSKWYYRMYTDDKTCQSVMKNFRTIERIIDAQFEEQDRSVYIRAIDYVENYIEFNYFDTRLSEQGERLYLYMNSRGETLSQQEIIKSSLIKKSKNKIEDGQKWEEWQDFFWRYRGNNINADIGFELFLKLATILHVFEFKLNEEQKNNKKSVPDSEVELLKRYIKTVSSEEKESQDRLLKEYQIQEHNFDVEWLDKVFQALSILEDNKLLAAPFFREGWLSNNQHTIDYVTICGVIYYIMLRQNKDKLTLERLGMYLKNICFYTKNKNEPVTIVIYTLKMVSQMTDKPILDLDIENVLVDFCSNSDKFKIKCYKTAEREKWEKVFWKVTNNNKMSEYINGNILFLNKIIGEDISCDNFEHYYDLFDTKFYSREKSENANPAQLRRDLLKYCDDVTNSIIEWDGGCGEGMKRYHAFSYVESPIKLLEKHSSVIKKYLDEVPIDTSKFAGTWLNCFIEDRYQIFEYTYYKLFLSNDVENRDKKCPHIRLLGSVNASSKNNRLLHVHLFHMIWNQEKQNEKAQSWIYQFDTCVCEFTIYNDSGINIVTRTEVDPELEHYFFDIVYDASSGEWKLYVGSRREKGISPSFVNDHWKDWTGDYLENDGKIEFNHPFYKNENMSIEGDVNTAIEAFKSIIKSYT